MKNPPELTARFETAKSDLLGCWESPIRTNHKITGDWIYAADPETFEFSKAMWNMMPGHYSLYSTMVVIMQSASLTELLTFTK